MSDVRFPTDWRDPRFKVDPKDLVGDAPPTLDPGRVKNAKAKQSLRAQLLNIVEKLEDPCIQLLDFEGRVDNGLVNLPSSHGYLRQGYSGRSSFTISFELYDPRRNALNDPKQMEER